MTKIIRVFPRRTKATPVDILAYTGNPDMFAEADEVHISVTFTWDLPEAERLAEQWNHIAPVKIGGPATGMAGGEFVPGMYLRPGYVITSRGCPNHCWFCSVWKREGPIRELPICEGYNILDDNLLACSDEHIMAVFETLKKQKHPIEFTGGLEAKRLTKWHAEALKELKPKQVFFAYDTPDDLEPLREAGRIMRLAGHRFHPQSHVLRCYVLCGFPKDTMEAAGIRMRETINAGFTPMAMLWGDKTGESNMAWKKFQREWARPAIIYSN